MRASTVYLLFLCTLLSLQLDINAQTSNSLLGELIERLRNRGPSQSTTTRIPRVVVTPAAQTVSAQHNTTAAISTPTQQPTLAPSNVTKVQVSQSSAIPTGTEVTLSPPLSATSAGTQAMEVQVPLSTTPTGTEVTQSSPPSAVPIDAQHSNASLANTSNSQVPGITTTQHTVTVAPLQLLSPTNLAAMRDEFVALFRLSDTKITKYVQMGFHVCVGGCDGCLNLKDVSNIGLIPHYTELRRMHRKWQNVTTLADYAVISAYEAVKAGVGKDTNKCNVVRQCTIDLPFTAGRTTCPDPDNPPTPHFPKGEDITTPRRDITNAFKLSQSETVALLGCHSLGGAHLNHSGFEGFWDLTPNVLDNGYYQALTRMTFRQKFMPLANSSQWVGTSSNGNELMMLHADMIIKHRFKVRGSRKRASCSSTRRCSRARSTSRSVDRFASSNSLFLRTLGKAFVKMSNTANFDPSLRRHFE